MKPKFKKNKGHKILTPNGLEKFLGITKTIHKEYIHLHFNDFTELKCSLNHPIMLMDGNSIHAKDLDLTHLVKSKHGSVFLLYSEIIHEPIELYDIVNSGRNNVYYSNGILSHNCEFHGSGSTLIDGNTLKRLVHKDTLKQDEYNFVYEYPKEEHVYIATVDVSEGIGKDYSVITIFDVTTTPYNQVAVYRNNNLNPNYLPDIVYSLCTKYNNAFLIVETNKDEGVAKTLYNDLEYENMLTTTVEDGENEVDTTKRSELGLKQTKKSKRIGCSTLKMLIENDNLIVNDFNTITELGSFIKKGSSYEAAKNKNDDLVMCLVIFAWFTTQEFFSEFSDVNVIKRLREKFLQEQEEEGLGIFAFYSDGTEDYSNNGFETFNDVNYF